jgi:hypothetical protein
MRTDDEIQGSCLLEGGEQVLEVFVQAGSLRPDWGSRSAR